MAKLILSDVANLLDTSTSETTINTNNTAIETALENTLSRDGASPNTMLSSLDMNSNRVINLPAPLSVTEPLRLQDLNNFTGGTTVTSSDGSLTATPVGATSNVVINTAHPNTWTGTQTFVAPVLGTPTSGTLTNATGLPIATGVSGLAANVATFLATPTSANLANAVTNETGSGSLVFASSPALVTPTGIVKGDVGLGNVDNTSDVTKNAASVTLTNKTISGAANTLSNIALSSHATQAAYTLVGNNSGSVAAPTAVDIAAVTTKASPGVGDYILISDQSASGAWKKATVTSVSAASGPVTSIAGNAGAFTLSNGITNSTNDIRLTVGQLPGIASNTAANAGTIGEYVTATLGSGSAISLANGVAANITSISLTAGDWDVYGIVYYVPAASTAFALLQASVSQVSGSLDGTVGNTTQHAYQGSGAVTINTTSVHTMPTRVLINATTTIYLVTTATFSVSTVTGYGFLRARRIR